MLYHHELILELFLLNNAILMCHLNTKDTQVKANQIADINDKKNNLDHQPYTYWEIASLKHFSCCKKKSLRYLNYSKHKEIISERMDVGSILRNECYLDTMAQVLMTPY